MSMPKRLCASLSLSYKARKRASSWNNASKNCEKLLREFVIIKRIPLGCPSRNYDESLNFTEKTYTQEESFHLSLSLARGKEKNCDKLQTPQSSIPLPPRFFIREVGIDEYRVICFLFPSSIHVLCFDSV